MHMHTLRSQMARAASVGAIAVGASLVIGAGVASAAPADPPGGATPVAPHFYNGNVEGIRDTGSDTTFFMMQKIGDLYTGAGLYGCTLNTTTGDTTYNTNDQTLSNAGSSISYFCKDNTGGVTANVATTDVNDNWDRTEVTEGVDNVGSGAGQNQLCGAANTPLPVDFARSSKPSAGTCDEVQTGYAKDGIPILDYTVNPALIAGGTAAAPSTSTTAPYASINGGVIGPVTLGWQPGNPVNGPYTGSKLVDISNQDNGGGTGSTAYRLWCTAGSNQITDWGQLTNLGTTTTIASLHTVAGSTTITGTGLPGAVVAGNGVGGSGIQGGTKVLTTSSGSITVTPAPATSGTVTLSFTTVPEGFGTPNGVPIRIVGVNTSSGTEATFSSYANSGQGAAGGCTANMDNQAANDPNPATAPSPNAAHIALENNSDQLDQFAAQDYPSPDYVDQAIEVATSLYIESNGVYNTNPYAAASTVDGSSFPGNKLTEDGESPSTGNLLSNAYPTARTLFNIYRVSTIRASTGGFLNWICDSNTNFQKGLDNTTGLNFDTELQTLISTTFGFPRLTDESTAPNIATPLDGVAAPNTSCAATEQVVATGGSSTITLNSGGNFPADVNNATLSSTDLSGLTVVSGAGTATLTLSGPASGTSVSGGEAATFAGVPSVTAVALAQS